MTRVRVCCIRSIEGARLAIRLGASALDFVSEMPNGDRRIDLEQVEAFFSPIAAVLEAFADSGNLLIEKYYHSEPSWSLCFRHPRGGQAKVSVVREDSVTAWVTSIWWRDDYESFTRSLRRGRGKMCPRIPERVHALLKEELDEVLGWRDGDWEEIVGGFEGSWGRYSKAEFERLTPDCPSLGRGR